MAEGLRIAGVAALAAAILLALSASAYVEAGSTQPQGLNATVLRRELISIYSRVVSLSEVGVNVTPVVHELRRALTLIDEGDNHSLAEASLILRNASMEVSVLEAEAPRIKLINELSLYGTVAALASIPILIYFLLPKAYLLYWFRTRRRWLVRDERA